MCERVGGGGGVATESGQKLNRERSMETWHHSGNIGHHASGICRCLQGYGHFRIQTGPPGTIRISGGIDVFDSILPSGRTDKGGRPPVMAWHADVLRNTCGGVIGLPWVRVRDVLNSRSLRE